MCAGSAKSVGQRAGLLAARRHEADQSVTHRAQQAKGAIEHGNAFGRAEHAVDLRRGRSGSARGGAGGESGACETGRVGGPHAGAASRVVGVPYLQSYNYQWATLTNYW